MRSVATSVSVGTVGMPALAGNADIATTDVVATIARIRTPASRFMRVSVSREPDDVTDPFAGQRNVSARAWISDASNGIHRAAPGMPYAAEGIPNAAFGMPNAPYGLPNVAYGLPNAAYGLPNAAYGLPNAAYGLPNAAYGLPNAAYGMPND